MQSKHILLGLLQACTSLKQAQQTHCQMITKNLASETILLDKLLSFCAISDDGCLDYACTIFSRTDQPSVLMWNVMIRGHSLYNKPEQTLFFFKRMHQAGLSPNNYTYPFLLKSCALLSETKHGEGIHGHAVKSGFELDVFVSSALLHLYSSSERMESAELLFVKMPIRNVVSWTTMIAGYAHCGKGADAIRVFKEMQVNNIHPNHVTLVSVLAACALTGDLEMGRFIHGYVRRGGMQRVTALETALLDMYAKCGRLDVSSELFNEMPDKNIISWNAIISAYNQASQHKEAVGLFYRMRLQNIKPDKVTSSGILTACAHLGDGGLGQAIHAYVIKNNFNKSGALGTALIDMYSKLGDTDSAVQIFHSISHKDAFTWTAMIAGLAMHGQGKGALDLFEEMLREGVHPDEVTYMAVLSACSHAGLVQKGCEYFDYMTTLHGIQPTEEHYGCLADLLSRAGLLEEAERLVESIPVRPNVAIYTALLSGCRIYRNADLAQRITKKIVELKPERAGVHVLLSNVYAREGTWQGVKLARKVMKEKRIKKYPGWSSIIRNADRL
ncbi:putative pentatricopeptide repeat-containing protein [Nymphaea thermarum]|nr:putative pentatricopeptide repeat-containing protein [Nymphaea thermarum]